MRIVLFLVAALTLELGAQAIPPALQQMADTERAFARRAGEVTIREAFIEYFADESITFEPDPVPAREALRKRNQPQTPGVRLLWEPRLGDVAASGDLGYLTGPSEQIVPDRPTRYGNYFSVWKRMAGGEYRVILDVGVNTPEKPAFAPGFVRAAPVALWKGHEARSASEASLLIADKAFGAETAARGVAEAYARVMHADARFMRVGIQPMTSRDAALAWMKASVRTWATEPMKSETSALGDLGYTWGRFTFTPTSGDAQKGYYIRVWTRKADGSWQLAAEVASPTRPPA